MYKYHSGEGSPFPTGPVLPNKHTHHCADNRTETERITGLFLPESHDSPVYLDAASSLPASLGGVWYPHRTQTEEQREKPIYNQEE